MILAGAILGCSQSFRESLESLSLTSFLLAAGLLWSAQGAIMMSYPQEKDKGRAFSIFWTIFQMGTLVGAAIALGIQAHSTLPSVSTGVYLAFMIIQLTSIVSSWLILPPRESVRFKGILTDDNIDLVIRNDGTLVELQFALGPKEEFRQFLRLFKDWRMIALL